MIGSDKRRGKEDAMVVWVLIDLLNIFHDLSVLFFLSGSKEKDISLHSVDEQTRDNLNIGISLFCLGQVFFTVVLTGIEDDHFSAI